MEGFGPVSASRDVGQIQSYFVRSWYAAKNIKAFEEHHKLMEIRSAQGMVLLLLSLVSLALPMSLEEPLLFAVPYMLLAFTIFVFITAGGHEREAVKFMRLAEKQVGRHWYY